MAGPTDVKSQTPCSCYRCIGRKGEIGKEEQDGRDGKGKHYFLGPMCSTHCHSSLSCSRCHCGMAEVGSDLKKPQLLLWSQQGDGLVKETFGTLAPHADAYSVFSASPVKYFNCF